MCTKDLFNFESQEQGSSVRVSPDITMITKNASFKRLRYNFRFIGLQLVFSRAYFIERRSFKVFFYQFMEFQIKTSLDISYSQPRRVSPCLT